MSDLNKVLNIVADILEEDVSTINVNTVLDEENWDSLAVISFISEVDSVFGKVLLPDDVNNVKNVSDLLNLL